ncbi:hypothetical protein CFE70_000260 [Pyrenophora teres f. teres 0-1]|uniref:Uncharacterized protein n=2 Tax=Pyrenophora teres f. teres TaxID=97479 RepID=E3RGL6_PYRTT|nr:hypothetical protein PTT_06951 [Pyrenophora teres f. teres 0-1]KAE8836481.1 hypothetical protein HRS9139_04579 [Pyrenophora teres f. teres]KAE8837547.1 hypothetical protein PTNB85_04882 [Pyrenophora teres f. teres]KAE8840033.1 hypothetical protein HRS9122_06638 [Pyrenophora teres f. teres]KAE8862373.1 hypothetical protein PTNB29_04935 [Pyrenophora teres f. teres]
MSLFEQSPQSLSQIQQPNAQEGDLDHVLSILAIHNHPFILIGLTAQRWMGAAGNLTNTCDILIRDNSLEQIATSLISSSHWTLHDPGADEFSWYPRAECDADIFLVRSTVSNENEFQILCLWTESTYHLNVDESEKVEVPDVYPWQIMLIDLAWHPALYRSDGWWFGPDLHSDIHSTQPHLPQRAAAPRRIFHSLPRGKSAGNAQKIFVPSLGPYLDALVYHKKCYQESKPGLAAESGLQIQNLTRYLYLELEGQRNALLMVMEEDEFMEAYLKRYKRKPFFVYRTKGQDGQAVFEATRVQKWDPSSYPDWCREKTKNSGN